jgi:heme exporter protein C
MSEASISLPKWVRFYTVLSVIFFIGAQVFAFMNSPPDRDMGQLQKIMYVHVPAAWMSLLSFTVVFVFCVLYLWRRNPQHDLVAASMAEVGTVFTGLTLALGSIWGRPTWGVWWTWDPRLTTTAIMMLFFVGYLALRGFTEDEERRARWSAAVGILGFINVPIVYMSVRWWRSIHQIQSTPRSVHPEYALGLRLNAFAFLFLMIALVLTRYHLALLARAVEGRAEQAALSEKEVHV